jgi:hypothetical protein
MRKFAYALALTAVATSGLLGCSDVGDSSVVAGDAQSPLDEAGLPVEASPGSDGTVPTPDSGLDSTVPPTNDANTSDVSTPPDASEPDAADGATPDTGAAETGTPDAESDGGPADTGTDAGPDATEPDAGSDAGTDSGSADAGHDASGSDAGSDGGSVLAPCTTVGQPNCVACNNGSPNSLCTPTEAAILARDIAKGYVTAPSATGPIDGCYACLEASSALDDATDTQQECSDTTNPTECLATLNCILNSECAVNAVNICYCGTAPVSTTCNADGTGAANGVCAAVIAAGFGQPVTNGHTILGEYTLKTAPSGEADAIFARALSNSCTQCQQ